MVHNNRWVRCEIRTPKDAPPAGGPAGARRAAGGEALPDPKALAAYEYYQKSTGEKRRSPRTERSTYYYVAARLGAGGKETCARSAGLVYERPKALLV